MNSERDAIFMACAATTGNPYKNRWHSPAWSGKSRHRDGKCRDLDWLRGFAAPPTGRCRAELGLGALRGKPAQAYLISVELSPPADLPRRVSPRATRPCLQGLAVHVHSNGRHLKLILTVGPIKRAERG